MTSRRPVPAFLALAMGLPAVAAAAACDSTAARRADAAEGERQPELVIFVYDRSTSMPDHLLTLARDLTNQRVDELRHGDRVAALELLQLSLAEPPKRWAQPVPKREVEQHEIARDSVMLARFLKDTKDYLVSFADTANRDDIDGTDILSTLHDVAAELRAYRDHRATAYLFSDMLQSNRIIDMEGLRRMPPAGWVRDAAAKGLLPGLTGLCVVVVGARVDTEAAQRVKGFWKEYFEATGAVLLEENYTLRPVRLPTHPCPAVQ